jgi:hypothetical protein
MMEIQIFSSEVGMYTPVKRNSEKKLTNLIIQGTGRFIVMTILLAAMVFALLFWVESQRS